MSIKKLTNLGKVGFIGGGNMAGAIIGGLLNTNYPPHMISVSEPFPARQQQLKDLYKGIEVTIDNSKCALDAKALILAVKPSVTKEVLTNKEFGRVVGKQDTLLISLVAGVKLDTMNLWAKETMSKVPSVVRCMPNTPCLIGQGAIGLYTSPETSKSTRDLASQLLSTVTTSNGLVWVEKEYLIDAITSVSGSGPAYFFYFVELIQKEGVKMGLTEQQARDLAISTGLGALSLASEKSKEQVGVEELRRNVTSPNGTTHAAIEQFKKDNLEKVVANAMQSCYQRSIQIGNELGEQ